MTWKDENFGETGLKVQPSELVNKERMRFLSFTNDDGNYFIPRMRSDDLTLFEAGILLQQEPLSCYYATEYNGTIYHVFNAERIVDLSFLTSSHMESFVTE